MKLKDKARLEEMYKHIDWHMNAKYFQPCTLTVQGLTYYVTKSSILGRDNENTTVKRYDRVSS